MKYLIALIMLVSFNTFAGDVIVGFKSYHFNSTIKVTAVVGQ